MFLSAFTYQLLHGSPDRENYEQNEMSQYPPEMDKQPLLEADRLLTGLLSQTPVPDVHPQPRPMFSPEIHPPAKTLLAPEIHPGPRSMAPIQQYQQYAPQQQQQGSFAVSIFKRRDTLSQVGKDRFTSVPIHPLRLHV